MTSEPWLDSKVMDAVAERREELVDLARALIAFDTTARGSGDPARDEAALQEHLAERLRRAGAHIDLWEPASDEVAGNRQVPDDIDFRGRPQLTARFAGAGSGRSLLFNGHIDAVSVEPLERWTSHPLEAEVRDGRLYGRGACDMKGGVAAMVLAAEVLADLGVSLRGDLIVNTVTDEEWNGAGALAAVAHGVRADAGLVPEPTGFRAWICCRGIMNPTITVPGRTGHAEDPPIDWRAGGAVNAIEKALPVLAALRELQEDWQRRRELRHPLVQAGHIVPTVIAGGEWWVTVPGSCRITFDLTYLPAQAAADGYGADVRREVEARVAEAAARDSWLAEHAPTITWETDLPPAELAADHPIVGLALQCAAAVDRPGGVAGLHSWHDPATFIRSGTPTISFGPAGHGLHAVDECVPVDDLVACAQAYALAAIRFAA